MSTVPVPVDQPGGSVTHLVRQGGANTVWEIYTDMELHVVIQLISSAFEHYLGNLWFVWPIDCNVKHSIFQSTYFPYAQCSNTSGTTS